MVDPNAVSDVVADELARERGSVTGTEREAARRGAALALALAAQTELPDGKIVITAPVRPSIPAWFVPDGVGVDECRRSAILSADRTQVAQVIHHHGQDVACISPTLQGCELVAPGGVSIPYVLAVDSDLVR